MNLFELLKDNSFYLCEDLYTNLSLYYDNDWMIECYSDEGRHEIELETILNEYTPYRFNKYDLGCDLDVVLKAIKNGYIYINGEYAEAIMLNYENDDWYIHTYWNEYDVKVRDYGKVWCLESE